MLILLLSSCNLNMDGGSAGIDLPLTFLKVAGVEPGPKVDYDGECMFEAISGEKQQ